MILALRGLLFRILLWGLLVGLASHVEAETFNGGDLFYAANQAGAHIFNITRGGDFSDAMPFASGGAANHANLGQMAWSHDLTIMYATNCVGNSVYRIDASGTSSLYVDVPEPVGIVVTSGGRILVNSFSAQQVLDITDPLKIATFASLPTLARNMRQLTSGEILVAGSEGKVFDIASGSATVYASIGSAGSSYLGDIDFTSDGRVFVTGGLSRANKVYEITGGGEFRTPFAILVNAPSNGGAFGLAINQKTNQIFAAPRGRNYVLDITLGGVVDASSASPRRFARNIPTTNDMAIDFVPWRPRPVSNSASNALVWIHDVPLPDRFPYSSATSSDFAAGLPRAQDQPESLPEPGTLTIWGLGALLCAAAYCLRRRAA